MKRSKTLKAPSEGENPRVWMTLAPRTRKWGGALMHQQCWCFGADIRRAQGNVLIEMGFERHKTPSKSGSNCYWREPNDVWIALWGFGMCFGVRERGSIFLARNTFWPRFSARPCLDEPAWQPAQLGEQFGAPRSQDECRAALDLMQDALLWLAEYERAILANYGLDYRRQSLDSWTHTVVSPAQVPGEWDKLAFQTRSNARFWTRDEGGLRQLSLETAPSIFL